MASLETWIGLRYLRAKKRNGFMSIISAVSIAGIALGVITLIVVLSVMNGFQREIRNQLLSIAPHAELGYYQNSDDRHWQDLQKLVQGNKQVLGSAPYVADQALLANGGEVRGVQIRGIDPAIESNVVDYEKDISPDGFKGLKPGEFDIILGKGLAEALGANIGDKITVITPDGNVTPAGMVPRLKQFTLVGILYTKIFEVDNSLAMTHIADAQKLYRLGDAVSGVRLKLADPQEAPSIIHKIVPGNLQSQIWINDWTYQNRSYFDAVQIEKRMLFIILLLIIAVAAFNLVSSLVMAVTEKQADIAILRTLGMSPAGIMRIFIIQGAVAGFMGTLIGVILGVTLALNVGKIVALIEDLVGRRLITSQIYFVDYMPSYIKVSDVCVIAFAALLLSFLATIYPSWRAAKTQPAEALRYE